VTPGAAGVRVPYQPELDGLRALSVLLIIAHHTPGLRGLVPGWFRGCFLGVDLFFVLSGALITRLLLAEIDATGALSLRRFYARRLRRLYPGLLAMLAAVCLVVARWLPGELASTGRDAAYCALYLGAWIVPYRPIRFFGHTWSLSIEEAFYLVWPLLLGLLVRAGRRSIVLALLLVVAVCEAWRFYLWVGLTASSGRLYFSPDTRADTLAFGALVGLAVHTGAAARWRGPLRVLGPLAGLGLGALVVVANRADPWYGVYGYPLASLLASLVVARLMVAPARWLSLPPLVGLGRLSYSLYLWHLPAFELGSAWGAPTWLSLAVGVTLAVASYRLIEGPLRAR